MATQNVLVEQAKMLITILDHFRRVEDKVTTQPIPAPVTLKSIREGLRIIQQTLYHLYDHFESADTQVFVQWYENRR